jgi:uroporphyrinogen decarboxylase
MEICKMTKRENLLNTLRREGYEKITCDMPLTSTKRKEFRKKFPLRTISSYYDFSHRISACFYRAGYKGNGRQLFAHLDLPDRFDVDPFGVGMSYGSKEAYHMCHFHSPLEGESTTLEQIQDYKLPTLIPGMEKMLKLFVKYCHSKGLAAMGYLDQTIWERAWLIRGMNDLMMDMMMDDDRATCILDRITDHSCKSGAILARTGHDIIALGDDVGMQSTVMMNPELWRKWLKPRLAKVIRTIREEKEDALVFYHSCGFIEPFIPDLIEIGVDILNPVQPECMDFREIHSQYGDKISFWGGIGAQTTFPFGSTDDVRARVRELIEISGEKGGLVIAPAHELSPEVPWENQEAMLDEIRKLNNTQR